MATDSRRHQTAVGHAHYAGQRRALFQGVPMNGVSGGYQLTLNATTTGAYRLTVRWRLNSDPRRHLPLLQRRTQRRLQQARPLHRCFSEDDSGHGDV
jgi:hypothetical protein